MREAIEARFAPVCALPGVADAAEGERGDGAVGEGVVDGSTAGAELAQDAVGFGFGAEGVEAEWGGMDFGCEADGVGEVGDGEEGHERAEGFFGDEAVVDGVDLEDGGFNVEFFFVRGAADEDLAFGGVEEFFEAGPLFVVDDAAEVGGGFHAVGVE